MYHVPRVLARVRTVGRHVGDDTPLIPLAITYGIVGT